ncbi:MAG: dockerin type repeat family protein [Pedosphaera sp.]|nr:dockerin type repeat family protein [Pedosphaera sp.]
MEPTALLRAGATTRRSNAPSPTPSQQNIPRRSIRRSGAFSGFLATITGVFCATAALAESDHSPKLKFQLVEATIPQMREAMRSDVVTSEQLVQMYFNRVNAYDFNGPALNSYLYVNTNALDQAALLDALAEGRASGEQLNRWGCTEKEFKQMRRLTDTDAPLYGIPVLIKDNIATGDMPTTAGSVALAGCIPAQDAFITKKLRAAGAVILGKATMTEFANYLTTNMPAGYSSFGGYGFNPYDPRPLPGGDGRPVLSPSGSSSGPGIAASANLAAACIGSETSGSILSPANANGVVGIKPTVGLVSRTGIVPITADQDTAGPLCRTVTDAAIMLSVIAGYDPEDPATKACLTRGNWHPDYTEFLKKGALNGARIAVASNVYATTIVVSNAVPILRQLGAYVEIIPALSNVTSPSILSYGFKRDLSAYLAKLPPSWPVRTLADIIAVNNATPGALKYGQFFALQANALDISPGSADTLTYQSNYLAGITQSRGILDAVYNGPDGIKGTSDDFDAVLNPGAGTPARAGYPSVSVPGGMLPPAGAVTNSFPNNVVFSGPAFSEAKLIALAYAFEQATKLRTPPPLVPPLPTDYVYRH